MCNIMTRIITKMKMIARNISIISTIVFIICFISCILLVLLSPMFPHDIVSSLLHIMFYIAAISATILIVKHWKD
jgi:hypothetical protein